MSGARAASGGMAKRLPAAALLLLPLLYLNLLFTVANVASTPGVALTPRLSIDVLLLASLVGFCVARGVRGMGWLRGALALVLLIAAVVRYVHITVPGVMGRELDVYADLPHLRSVVGVFWEGVPHVAFVALSAGALLLVAAGVLANWVALRAMETALRRPGVRRTVWALTALAVVTLPFVAGALFAQPMAAIAAEYVDQVRHPLRGSDFEAARSLQTRHSWQSDLAGLDGAHVILVFLESYGVTLIEDEQHYPYIAPRYRRFERRLRDEGFAVRSAQIRSPTFGGGSWRAHGTLLSGVRLTNQQLYEMLLASERQTLVHLLATKGYRTVAAEPGIQGEWPEAEFFGFDRIYDAAGLDYRDKEIGWWKIPDQFTLYQIHRRELAAATRPVFAKIALIMSHIPYSPVPPYVEDWSRFDTGGAYAHSIPSVAADDYRDLTHLSSRYVEAFRYELAILEDFAIDLLPENALLVIAGDHQPPKLVTHDNDSWAVPIHLLSRRHDLVEPFARFGFEEGLVPHRPFELAMEDFLPAFVAAFHGGDE